MLFAFLKLDNKKLFTSLRNYGFKAISDKHWQKLLNAIQLLESNQLAYFKIQQEIKQLREHAATSSHTESVKTLLALSQWIAPHYIAWKKKHIALFNNPAWWEKRLTFAKTLEEPLQTKAVQTLPFDSSGSNKTITRFIVRLI